MNGKSTVQRGSPMCWLRNSNSGSERAIVTMTRFEILWACEVDKLPNEPKIKLTGSAEFCRMIILFLIFVFNKKEWLILYVNL